MPSLERKPSQRSGWQIGVTGILWHRDEHNPLAQLGSMSRGPRLAALVAGVDTNARRPA
jgi:hypothetical protein